MEHKLMEIIADMAVGDYKYIRRNAFDLSLEGFQVVCDLIHVLQGTGDVLITDIHHEGYTGDQLIDLIQIERLK